MTEITAVPETVSTIARTVAVPGRIAVTRPLELTLATSPRLGGPGDGAVRDRVAARVARRGRVPDRVAPHEAGRRRRHLHLHDLLPHEHREHHRERAVARFDQP